MNDFNYIARNSDGALLEGSQRGASADNVASALKKANLVPIKIIKRPESWRAKIKAFGQVSITSISETQRLMFCRQMESLLRTGLSVSTALDSVARSVHSVDIKASLSRVSDDVSAGHELATALQRDNKILPPLAISLIHAGEQVGQLDVAFGQICEQLEREQATRRDVWEALRYPIIVIIALIAVLMVLNIFAVPAFQRIFSQLGADLPWATQILVAASEFINDHGVTFAVIIIASLFLLSVALRFHEVELVWCKTKMKIPLVSRIFNYCMMSRFCDSLSIMVDSGIPLMRALNISADITGNSYFKSRMQHLKKHLKAGGSLESAAKRTGLFSPVVIEMLTVGESSGSLSRLLKQVGIYYETEARYQAKQLSSLIQPLLLCFLAGVVAIFAMGVYLPMWAMMTNYL